MPDNLPAAPDDFHALADHAIVVLEGPDARAFAQAQFANDVDALEAGQWQWNCWLTPKGRVLALFALVRTGLEQWLVIAPDYGAESLAADLRRLVFRRKLAVRTDHGLVASGAMRAPIAAGSARIALHAGAWELDFSGADTHRTMRIAQGPSPADVAFASRWRALDLVHGLPRLEPGQRDRWTPQQLSLERLRAFSVRKGCYPGQEIVARTHFLGKAKRALGLVRGSIPLPAGTELREDGRAVGEIVASDAGAMLALAVLPVGQDLALLSALGTPLHAALLQAGMARG